MWSKYSSLLNTLKGNCFDDEQYVYCTNSHGTEARGLGLDLGLKNLVLFTPLPSFQLLRLSILELQACTGRTVRNTDQV